MRLNIKHKLVLSMYQFKRKSLIIMQLNIRLNMFHRLNTRQLPNMSLRKELLKKLTTR